MAKEAYAAGAAVGNDISGFADPEYLPVAAAAGATVVATHIRLGPRIPDPEPVYDDVVEAVAAFLVERAGWARAAGLTPDRIVLDAGLDLGKTSEQSLALLRASDRLARLGYPLLLSASNKTFLGVVLGLELGDRREASLAAAAMGVALGCRIVRVHDAAAHRQLCSCPGRHHRGPINPWHRWGRSAGWMVSAASSAVDAGTASGSGTAERAVYLVRGDDPALVAQAAHALCERLVAGGDQSLMVEEFGGPGVDPFDVGAVIDACTTPPFLVERRVVVVRETGQLTASDAKRLTAYLEDPLATTALVLVAGGGAVPPTLSKAAGTAGEVLDTTVGRGNKARSQWLAEHLKGGPVRLDGHATARLSEHLGEDMGRLAGLLDTLASAYGPGASVTVDDLEPFLGEAGSLAPWDLTDAIDAGKTAQALSVLHRMLVAGDSHPLVVMTLLHRHYRQILRLDGAEATSPEQAAQILGMRSAFPAKKALAQSRRLGTARTARTIRLLADADLDLRGSTMLAGQTVLEVLVARLSRLARQGP